MNHKTILDELKAEIKTFCEARNWGQFHGIKDLAIGVSTEAAELLEIFRFVDQETCEKIVSGEKKREIRDELADIFFFLLRISEKYDIDLVEALKTKMQMNAQRYPVARSKNSNKKYNEI